MSLGIRCDWLRLPLMGIAFVAGIGLAAVVGPFIENWLFASDIMAWLDGQTGTATGGWMLLFLPVSTLLTAVVFSLFVTPLQRNMAGTRTQFVLLDIMKFLAGSLTVVGVAWLVSAAVSAAGFDLRGTLVDTYVQRNSLVVGFMMGFAIIPIIYTISDDALTSVPESLRAASLGAGATKWQTAVRVIIPTGMSGLFSALMIGLGRAVGETMIVLMAAGNTPVLDMNIFNGFRTLAANIAVELPEAVENSTHFRMLYLAALSLFALTFVLNTVAEIIRLRFRKRAFQL
jgi:phosphate transport system permease protein